MRPRRAASLGAALLALLTPLTLLTSCQWAPTPEDEGLWIQGEVVDGSTRQRLDGVRIELHRNGSQGAVLVGLTDAAGYYSEPVGDPQQPPKGQLTFSREGYQTASFRHVPTDSYTSMHFGCWETVPEVVELTPLVALTTRVP